MRRIGYLVPEFPGQTHAFFWREIEAMEEAGAKLELFSTRRPGPNACPHAFADIARARTRYVFPPSMQAAPHLVAHPGGVAGALGYLGGLVETPAKARARLLPLVACAADLARECRRRGVDHLHVHSFADAAHLAALARRLGGPPYSLTLHGDLPVYGVDHAAKTRDAAFCVGVTAPLMAQIREIYSGPVHLIPMGVNVDRFRPHQGPAAGASGRPLLAVTVARLNHAKGHRYFLQAMRQAVAAGVDIRYVIAGTGPYQARLEAEIAEAGLDGRIELAGQLGEEAVLDLLRRADLFALTSVGKGEAAPVSVMEAMACGLPIVCSRIGGTGDMIEDGVDGFLVPQEDVPAIVRAIIRLAEEPEFASRMSEAARRTAVSRFSHHASAARLLEAVEEVSGKDAARAENGDFR